MSFEMPDSIVSLLPFQFGFLCFLCLIAVTSNTKNWNKSGESGHPLSWFLVLEEMLHLFVDDGDVSCGFVIYSHMLHLKINPKKDYHHGSSMV